MKRTFVPVLYLFACLAAALLWDIPAACQEDFVRIQGDQFTYKGQTVRLKGTNYYPKNHMWAGMWSSWDWDEMLTEVTFIRELGMNCVRILVPYNNDDGGWGNGYPPISRLQQLEDLVNMFGQNGIRTCITLFDWETSFPYPYEAEYSLHVNYVTTIVNRFKDNKYVFMWDVKNEPDHPENLNSSLFHSNPQVVIDDWDDPRTELGKKDRIVTWLGNMCRVIDDLDSNHPVSAGLRYYKNVNDVLPFVDVCIYHDYWWPEAADEILTVKGYMGANQKPILVEEFGWPSYPPSRNFTEDNQLNVYNITLSAYEQYNIAGCMQWMTFDAANYGNVNHENYYGLWRHDYSMKPAGEYYRDHFITGPFPYIDTTPPGAVSGFKAEAKNGANYLSWTNSQARDYQATIIRYSTTGYPVSITDGQLLTDQVGTPGVSGSFLHQGLTNGVTYYYTAFARDRFGNYSSAANTSGTPYIPPVVSVLPNGTIDTTAGGVASSWTAYRINDPGNILQFIGNTYFETAPVSQGISGLESTLLPPNSYVAAGIRQVVPATVGKTYMFVGMQDLTGSASGARYLHNFGISTTPGTNITFKAYVRCWAFDGATNPVQAYVGIDPTGGTDITAGTVVWSPMTRNNYWTQLTASAVAQSNTATLFVRGSSAGEDPGQYHVVYFDDASATWTPSDNIAPTNPTYAQDLGGAQDGQWTDNSAPSFIFGGADDTGGSGIAGYDVYWGTNPTGSTATAAVTDPAYQPAALSASGTYYLRVRTRDAAGNTAAWTTLFVYKYDPTAPSAPGPASCQSAYLVDGKVTVEWTPATDAESGISGYWYCVGNSPGSNDVLDWTYAGNVTSTEVLVPNPQTGSVYYITLKARNGAGTDSGSSVQAQATAAVTEAAIGPAKRHPAGTPVAIKGKIVTAVFQDLIYIQDPDAPAGIGVDCPTRPAPGTVVDVVGRLADGNKVLSSAEVKAR